MKYQSILTKPLVEAVVWNGNTISEVTPWIREGLQKFMPKPGALMRLNYPTGNVIHIGTKNGVMIANPGNYIVRHHDGEIVPWIKQCFEQIYNH